MVQPLILQYYQLLPNTVSRKNPPNGPRQFRKALARFKRAVDARYNEATLLRLRCIPIIRTFARRRCWQLGLLAGSIQVNALRGPASAR